MSYLSHYLRSESGAITVDWVVITSAVASLAIIVTVAIGTPAVNKGGEIGQYVGEMSLLQY